MSLRSIIEFSLHIDTFRNIDLFHQGIYKLNISILKDSVYAYPYNFISKYTPTLDDPHQITSTSLEETFIDTKSFLVRYFDELVRIEETYYLRAEVELDKNTHQSYFTLKFDLLFTDFGGRISIDDIKHNNPSVFSYETISSCEFLLKFPNSFQTNCVPVVFDDNHCCLISSVVSYLLIDYKFRPLFNNRQADAIESLASSLFKLSHKSGREYIGSSLTDSTYSKLMNPLSKTYNYLREFYLTVLQKCLTDAQKHILQIYYVPPILSLPGNPVQNMNHVVKSPENFQVPLNFSDEESVSEDHPGTFHRFSQRVASHDAKKIATVIMAELSMVSGQIFQLWHRLQEVIPNCTDSLVSLLKEKYSINKRQLLSHGLLRKVVKSPDLGLVADRRKAELNKTLAIEKRQSNSSHDKKGKRIIDKRFEVDSKTQPILIEEFCILDRSLNDGPSELFGANSTFFSKDGRRRGNSNHLIVLVHGFQGSSSDMRIVKNMLYVNFPNNLYLCSSVNENNTECSIYVLGQRLAQEVMGYLKENCVLNLGRISFIGHSLGGLVIRAALVHLEEFSKKMHLFLTFSSPHLGIIEGSSKLIRAGLWVLNNFKKCESLKQLSFCDSLQIEECAIYKLAHEKGCEWFSHMVVISSPQDLYSPHYSARIEIIQDLQKFGRNTKFLAKMGKMILEGRDRIHRIDVDFSLPSANFDNFIGRAGHIEFLENHIFMKTLLYLHPEFFE